ncbi:MAG: hypothetical protein HKN04_13885 [Rhodothermaceae bacterium]|nr:hypothetical protein [Rhodothermaceae bacterium]
MGELDPEAAWLTYGDIRARWAVSRSTIDRARRSGAFPDAEKRSAAHGDAWHVPTDQVDALAAKRGWKRADALDETTDHRAQFDASRVRAREATDEALMVELGELRSKSEALTADLDRITAERDRARSDAEQERQRGDAAERDAIEQRARAEERDRTIADLRARLDAAHDDLRARLDALEAASAPQTPPEPTSTTNAPDTHHDHASTVTQRLTRWIGRKFGA